MGTSSSTATLQVRVEEKIYFIRYYERVMLNSLGVLNLQTQVFDNLELNYF
jgi:hypothetical protein